MNQTDQNKPYQIEDEINLKELIINLFQTLRKNFLLICIFIIVGAGLAVVAFKIINPVYKSQLIASTGIQLSDNSVNVINSWKGFLNKKDFEGLSKKINIREDYIKEIKSIDAESSGQEDKESKTKSFIINITVYNNNILDSLENGIVSYLKNNAAKNTLQKRKSLILFKIRIQNEIASLDSVKASLQRLILKGNFINNPFLTGPGNVNLTLVNLYGRSLEIEEEIQALDKINIVESFSKSDKPDGYSLIKLITIGLVIGLLFSLVIIFFKSIMEN